MNSHSLSTSTFFSKNRFKDLEIYFATENPENKMYVTDDAEGKYFPDLPDEHFIAPLDY